MLNTQTFTSITSPVLKLFQTDVSEIDINIGSNSSQIDLPEREIILLGSITDNWKIIQPLTITIELFDDLYVASENLFGIYGDGDTEYEALEDYKLSLIDYYQLLESRAQDDEQDNILFGHLKLYISPSE